MVNPRGNTQGTPTGRGSAGHGRTIGSNLPPQGRNARAGQTSRGATHGRQPHMCRGGHDTPNITQGYLGPSLAVIPRPVLAGSSSTSANPAGENQVVDPNAAAEPLILEMRTNRDLFEMREGDVILFLQIMSSDSDQNQFGTFSDGRIFRAMGAHLFLAIAQFMNIHDRFVCDQLENSNVEELKKNLNETEKELKAREKELVVKDKQIMKAPKVGSAAEDASIEKDRRIADLEVRLASSEAEIARLSDELGRAGQSYQQTLMNQRSRVGSRKDGSLQKVRDALSPILQQTYRFAVVNFRTQVFMNMVGQRFLESLHREMIARYRQTPQYLADLAPTMSYFMDEAVKIAMELM